MIEKYIEFGYGLFDEIEKKLKMKDDKNLKLLRNQPFKSKESFYNIYNFGCLQVDLGVMPHDAENGHDYKYFCLFVDMKSRLLFPCYLKTKNHDILVTCFKTALAFYKDVRFIQMDKGGEFYSKAIRKLLDDNGIRYQYGMTNRRFNGIVEYYIGVIKKFTLQKLSLKSLEKNAYDLDWTDIAQEVIDEINKFNKKTYPKKFIDNYDNYTPSKHDNLNIGDMVHVKLDHPKTLFGDKRMQGDSFRHGDLHFSKNKYKIDKIILTPNDRNLRYHLEGIPRTSFLRDELLL